MLDYVRGLSRRDLVFVLACGVVALMAGHPLKALVLAAFEQEQNSHNVLVLPVIMILLLIERRRKVNSVPMGLKGVPVVFVAIATWVFLIRYTEDLSSADRLSVSVLGVVIAWISLGVVFYGIGVLRRRTILVMFLLLLVPIPSLLLNPMIRALQYGSTSATQALFIATGIPVAREGFVLSLPRIDIEVAAECSGIRSTMMLLLTSMVLGHLFLVSAWRQGVLLVATVLITVLKNALRIYTLSMLAMYVDRSWIEGKFHHVYGGSVFFALSLAMVLVLIKLLRRSEGEPIAVRGVDRDEVRVT